MDVEGVHMDVEGVHMDVEGVHMRVCIWIVLMDIA